jgi:hypothetical protein
MHEGPSKKIKKQLRKLFKYKPTVNFKPKTRSNVCVRRRALATEESSNKKESEKRQAHFINWPKKKEGEESFCFEKKEGL